MVSSLHYVIKGNSVIHAYKCTQATDFDSLIVMIRSLATKDLTSAERLILSQAFGNREADKIVKDAQMRLTQLGNSKTMDALITDVMLDLSRYSSTVYGVGNTIQMVEVSTFLSSLLSEAEATRPLMARSYRRFQQYYVYDSKTFSPMCLFMSMVFIKSTDMSIDDGPTYELGAPGHTSGIIHTPAVSAKGIVMELLTRSLNISSADDLSLGNDDVATPPPPSPTAAEAKRIKIQNRKVALALAKNQHPAPTNGKEFVKLFIDSGIKAPLASKLAAAVAQASSAKANGGKT